MAKKYLISLFFIASVLGQKQTQDISGIIVDMDGERRTAYSEARARYFSDDNPPPASTLIGVSGLVIPVLQVEVEAIAVIEDD